MAIETQETRLRSPGRSPKPDLAGARLESASLDADILAKAVLKSLDDSKAEDIVPIDIRGKSSLADVMVVASGRSHRHVGAIADRLLSELHEAGYRDLRVEGLPHCDWVLVDAGDVLVHIFRPEVRGFYNLEKMWQSEPTAPRLVAG
ncbi:ribosome silencing factor [Prosthecomicrobium hirschii]|mgnify:CR=1 FL=1|uniref:ribosome silencing factor n=1 Tax=Prosthecodimorpha hirschii TaxID=665126 RepID=UPI0009FB5B22|nr:ribosome silencing factor [Prosthecomicrobium hirschii]MCW1841393.1 ribosome silencing factor [Prosthecomicrobium hirschii]TPQ52320.1 ribosome silencing factor [Prosthecomicrobium hirschii]